MVIILFASSPCAQKKWGSEEAIRSTSPTRWSPITESQVVRIRAPRQDLAGHETVLAARQ
jgi:hypothetical protein